jgi:hypothetical protein
LKYELPPALTGEGKIAFLLKGFSRKEIVSLIYISPQAGWALHFFLDQKTKQKSQGSPIKAS